MGALMTMEDCLPEVNTKLKDDLTLQHFLTVNGLLDGAHPRTSLGF
jgi:hypothetical protein